MIKVPYHTLRISASFLARISSICLIYLSVSFCTRSSASFLISSEDSVFLISLLASWRALRTPILASSLSPLACLTNSLRRYSVNGGRLMMITSPLFIGLKPRLATMMAFSMTDSMFFSHGCMLMVRESGVFTLATCAKGVCEP